MSMVTAFISSFIDNQIHSILKLIYSFFKKSTSNIRLLKKHSIITFDKIDDKINKINKNFTTFLNSSLEHLLRKD